MTSESAGAGRRHGERPPTIIEVADRAGVSTATPALSTVHQPVEKLAALAVRTLTDRAAPLDQRLPTHLVVRASSAA